MKFLILVETTKGKVLPAGHTGPLKDFHLCGQDTRIQSLRVDHYRKHWRDHLLTPDSRIQTLFGSMNEALEDSIRT